MHCKVKDGADGKWYYAFSKVILFVRMGGGTENGKHQVWWQKWQLGNEMSEIPSGNVKHAVYTMDAKQTDTLTVCIVSPGARRG